MGLQTSWSAMCKTIFMSRSPVTVTNTRNKDDGVQLARHIAYLHWRMFSVHAPTTAGVLFSPGSSHFNFIFLAGQFTYFLCLSPSPAIHLQNLHDSSSHFYLHWGSSSPKQFSSATPLLSFWIFNGLSDARDKVLVSSTVGPDHCRSFHLVIWNQERRTAKLRRAIYILVNFATISEMQSYEGYVDVIFAIGRSR